MKAVKKATDGWQYHAISIGYPGPVLEGKPHKDPANLGKGWVRFDFVKAFGVPVKIINDAANASAGPLLAVVECSFLVWVTRLGSALIVDGVHERVLCAREISYTIIE